MANSFATYYPKPELVYYAGEAIPDVKLLRLAFKLELFADTPRTRRVIFVDAQNGKIIGERNLIFDAQPPTKDWKSNPALSNSNKNNFRNILKKKISEGGVFGQAVTAYYGQQPIYDDDVTSTLYTLRDYMRGSGIFVLNMAGKARNYASATDFNSSSSTFGVFNPAIDRYATDAFMGQERTYDFYQTLGRNSINGTGSAIYGYVHQDMTLLGNANNIQAEWDGTEMNYGDGGGSITPLTPLDIVGHEMSHGVTQYTSELVYSKESGALNESFSDMMGASVENSQLGIGGNWTIGEKIGEILRDMSSPPAYGQPNTYGAGPFVSQTGCSPSLSNDYCGVHTNSGVGNFWYYLLEHGGAGTNGIGHSYNVTGLGWTEAEKIAFTTFTQYLTSTATYAIAQSESISSAGNLYGIVSPEVQAVTNAWYAVGVGQPYVPISGPLQICTNATYSVTPPTGATVTWTVSPSSNVVTMSPSGNSVTLTYVNPGTVTLTATITYNGKSATATPLGAIQVGAGPLYGSASITQSGSNYYLNDVVSLLPGTTASNYTWYKEVNNVPTTVMATGLSLNHWQVFSGQTLYYRCQGVTSCGTAVYRNYVNGTTLGPGNLVVYQITPNPASSQFVVTGSNNTPVTDDASVQPQSTLGTVKPTNFDVQLLNNAGQVLGHANSVIGKKITMNIQGIPNGFYFVHIQDGNQSIKTTVIINH